MDEASGGPEHVRPRRPWADWLGIIVGAAVFAAALYSLRGELAAYNFRQVRAAVRLTHPIFVVRGVLFAIGAYAALVLCDVLAIRYIKRSLPTQRIALLSFISHAFSNALGFPLILGGGLRYRLYNTAGLSSAEIALTVGFNSVTFWLGVFAVGGGALVFAPVGPPELFGLPLASLRAAGALVLLLPPAYVAACALARKPIRIGGWEFQPPSGRLALAQLATACVDWVLVAAVLWAVIQLPPDNLTFGVVLAAFVVAHVAGLLSHVPGGLGVFEFTFVALLRPYAEPTSLLSSVVVFRIIYFLFPLSLALLVLTGNEFARGRTRFARAARMGGGWVRGATPAILALTTFIGGTFLLISGATPELRLRLSMLARFVPLAVIESSHFVSSLTGAALLILAWGLGRRLDAAYYLTLVALPIGIVSSLLKGFDYEEAAALGVIFVTLLPARRLFYRRSSLTAEALSPSWVLMILTVLVVSAWLGFLAYKNVAYSNDLWWRFTLRGDAPRFLRALVGVAVAVALVALQRLLRPAREASVSPDEQTLARARQVVCGASDTHGHLALLGDKSLLFSDDGAAFVMYGVAGGSFVAMGDPIGAPRDRKDLVWRFRELANRHGAATVFYQVRKHNLPLYLDVGLSLLKLGEEARVPLRGFSLDGGPRKRLRRTVKTVEAAGCQFDVIRGQQMEAALPELKTVSDQWLERTRTREKGFSLGFFDERYLRDTPVAVVRRGAAIVAFANLWEGGDREELAVDLMRYGTEAPESVMEYLFTKLLLWGRAAGFAHANLGMAPLSGLQNRELAPIWNRVGALLFQHTEKFYNFQGLRGFKQKFDPIWEPRYLASRGGLALPRILTNVSVLVSRGLRGAVAK